MFKLFKNKKKAKKEKEKQQKDANKENSTPTSPKTAVAESSSPTDSNHHDKQNGGVEMRATTNTTATCVTPNQQQQLNVDCNLNTNESSCQASPSVFTESQNYDSHNHLHHYRSSHLSTLSAGAGDLNRILTSGYLTGDDDMGYLKRGVDLHVPKSPHFHRPDNFSYNNNHHVNLIVASSNPYRKSNKGLLTSQLASMTGQIKKIRHSTSTSPKRVNIENEEPIRLSKFSGGYQPDPAQPAKIESLDWPSPPYPPAVPELRSRSRSSSHRKLNTSSRADQIDSSMIANGVDDDDDDHIPTKIHYTHKVYDDNYQDYTIRFRSRTTQPNSSRNSQQNQQSTSLPVCAQSPHQTVVDHEIDLDSLIQKDPKLKRDLEEMTKLENKSGMAKMFNIELKAQERLIQRALDPWKASRTPSASIEPHQKTRYETPFNASPSRVLCCCNKIHTTVYEDGQCSTCGGQQQPHQHHSLSTNGGQTTPVSHLCSTPRKGGTIPKAAAPKPGYGLSSPKSTTLPNSTRYYGMTTHRSVDFDSNALTTGSYYAGETPIVSDKIYPYSELKLGYKKKLPADVDRERLERHLATDELIRLFGVDTLEKFYELPEWKRVELKKKAKLF